MYLGTITRDPAAPAKPPVISGDPVYIGARAAQVFTPAGDARLASAGTSPSTRPSGQLSRPAVETRGECGTERAAHGGRRAAVGGDLSINGGRVVIPHGAASEQQVRAGNSTTCTSTAAGSTVEQLRLVLGDPATAGAATEFVVGRFSNGQFTPCLTVAADGTVTVHGNLVVKGTAELKGGTIS